MNILYRNTIHTWTAAENKKSFSGNYVTQSKTISLGIEMETIAKFKLA